MPAPQKVDREEFARLAATMTNAELSEHFECSPATVTRLRAQTGTARPRRIMTTERLTKIQRMLDEGMPFNEIHRTEGADPHTLRKHFPGQAWTLQQSINHRQTIRTLTPQIRRTYGRAAA